MARIQTPQFGLSLQWIAADARTVDWQEVGGEDYPAYEVQLPKPRYEDWQDNASDAPARIDRMNGRRVMSEADAQAFEGTEAHDQWRDGFYPMMNYAWPVSLAYGLDLQSAVDAMAEHATACVLIELNEEAQSTLYGDNSDAPDYVIALTGGGMDLSDHIAAAYLACGCVPPSRILSGLAGVISPEKARRLPLRDAYKRAAEHYAHKAKNLRATASGMFRKGAK